MVPQRKVMFPQQLPCLLALELILHGTQRVVWDHRLLICALVFWLLVTIHYVHTSYALFPILYSLQINFLRLLILEPLHICSQISSLVTYCASKEEVRLTQVVLGLFGSLYLCLIDFFPVIVFGISSFSWELWIFSKLDMWLFDNLSNPVLFLVNLNIPWACIFIFILLPTEIIYLYKE